MWFMYCGTWTSLWSYLLHTLTCCNQSISSQSYWYCFVVELLLNAWLVECVYITQWYTSCISQSAVRKTLSKRESRKFQFQDLYMLNVNLGDSSGLRIVVHVSAHFHNSHVLHTPSLCFLYTKSPNACCDVSVWLHQGTPISLSLIPMNE